MNKGFLEMIVAGSMLIGVATFTPNNTYAQQHEHNATKKTEVQKKECDMTKDKKSCCDMKGNEIKNMEKGMMMNYDTNPEVIKSVMPVYPSALSKKGIEGKVYVHIGIDKYGKPTSAMVMKSSGYTPLDSSALVAVKQYQFKPAIVKDKAVESMVTIPIEYKLK
jgi:TonB family protein